MFAFLVFISILRFYSNLTSNAACRLRTLAGNYYLLNSNLSSFGRCLLFFFANLCRMEYRTIFLPAPQPIRKIRVAKQTGSSILEGAKWQLVQAGWIRTQLWLNAWAGMVTNSNFKFWKLFLRLTKVSCTRAFLAPCYQPYKTWRFRSVPIPICHSTKNKYNLGKIELAVIPGLN